ncbi:MAG: MT-A70 family methyltransferase [Bacillota bacterium]|nr:MT-A70 family methyltransferase [Bacillota bacterium]
MGGADPFSGLRGGYGAIIADPPWRFRNRTGKVSPEHRRLWRYKTMALDEIMALPVGRLVAPKSHLYLWVPLALIGDGLAVMRAWGFSYKTALIWLKSRRDGAPHGGGIGFYFRTATEVVLFGTRGGLRTMPPARSIANVIVAPKRRHSEKPDELYEVVEASSPGPYLELFARKRRPGWDAWGDEVPPDDGAIESEGDVTEGRRGGPLAVLEGGGIGRG